MAKKVLVIDGEPEMLSLIQHALASDFDVHLCSDGRAAWAEIAKVKPDVVVLEAMLPGVDGYSLQLKMSQDPSTKNVPVVVVTSLESAKALFRKFPQVAGFMTKPFEAEQLLKMVCCAVEGRTVSEGLHG